MTLKPKALVLAILFVLLALPVLADQRPGQGAGNPSVDPSALTNPRFLAHYLNLTPAQVTQTQGFLATLQTALRRPGDPRAALSASADGPRREQPRPGDGRQGLPGPGQQSGADQDRAP